MNQASAFQNPIEYSCRQILVMEHVSPRRERLIGGEDHRALAEVAIVHHVKKDIRRIRSVGQVTDFVNHQDMRMSIGQ